MRLYLFTIALLFIINNNSFGQNIDLYENGSYIVAGNPFTVLSGEIKTKGNKLLLVKTPKGEKLQFYPEQIISFCTSTRKFIIVEGFKINGKNVHRGFAEVVDSGQVVLMRYNFTSNEASFANPKYPSGNIATTYYLLRKANSSGPPTALVNDWFYGPRKVFNTTLAQFVPPQRPDLLKLVQENTVSPRTIEAFIHALNTGQPFN